MTVSPFYLSPAGQAAIAARAEAMKKNLAERRAVRQVEQLIDDVKRQMRAADEGYRWPQVGPYPHPTPPAVVRRARRPE